MAHEYQTLDYDPATEKPSFAHSSITNIFMVKTSLDLTYFVNS